MLFNSLIFVIFTLLFFGVNWFIKKNIKIKLFWLTLTSFVFYGWWDWRFLFLIIFSGLVDFFAGLGMEKYPRQKKLMLILSVIANIGSLSLFKYAGFFAENIDKLFGFAADSGLYSRIPEFYLITPVGISFYTFQSMSYTLDIYKGKLKPTKSVMHFFAYLSMFPQLVAGPIVRAKDMLHQMTEIRPVNKDYQWEGLRLVVKGYFKKMVIADNLAPIVVAAFGNPAINDNSAIWWGAIIAFAFQIYCDFSGYSDIARGLAKWMGYDFPDNFNHPYVSTSLREFWTRWHISLSSWFRDYVYIPLGGGKKGKLRGHINLWITMVVSGLWHGAAWTYVVWGAVHALFSSIERFTKWPEKLIKNQFTRFLAWVFITLQVLVAWVFFRAESMDQALRVLKVMFRFQGSWDLGWHVNGSVYIMIILLREFLIYSGLEKRFKWEGRQGAVAEMIWFGFIIAIIIFFRGTGSEFIYFQF